jgi:ATP-dependent Zn protease
MYQARIFVYSPQTAKLVDEEVKKLNAKQILISEREHFEYLVERLIESETIYGKELRKLLEQWK